MVMAKRVASAFALTEEHDDFRSAVAEFAADQLAPHVERWNAAHELPMEAVKQMADLGLFGLNGPEEYGGAGDFTSLCVAIEEIGRVDQSLGITLEAAVGLGSNPIASFGSPDQKERWLPDLLAGHALAAFGLTEPDAGSDASATATPRSCTPAAAGSSTEPSSSSPTPAPTSPRWSP